ncbi:MAG TPA: serine/threonine-protein kinase [Thermoguttaceae bacterium]|nr:serine/threonine-protein kinase [Thermoguttaceae bacterium]
MTEASNQEHEPISADLSGRQLGDYRLLRRLGRGAMAEVYLAEQCSLNRQVAVKVLRRELANDQTYIQRFQREAQAAASLVHANIVQIHEVGCIDQVHFIAQEYIQGLNLRQWIARNGALDLRMALMVMWQVGAALSKAAEQGIVHRDIKPENIMLTRSGEVKVADFGLARVPTRGDAVELTQAGMTLGTPLYMSPEQVEGKPLDPRSDIYSFGVTCYHMLAGSPPFGGETALAVAVQHLKKSPDSLENLRPDLPPGLCRIVHRMLAKAPGDRYQSPRELLRELRQVQLEHLDEEWPEDLSGWEIPDLDTAATLHETTQHLDALMKTAGRGLGGRLRWFLLAAGLVIAFLVGGTLASLTVREQPLLAETGVAIQPVPKFENAISQWIYAVHVNTEDAWEAVDDYFPDTYWAHRAKQQLAWLYLRKDDYNRAKAKFEELAMLDGSQQELRAFGLAGQYWVLKQQEKPQEAAEILSELLPILPQLRDSRMRRMIGQVFLKSEEATTDQQIQQWLDQVEKEAAEAD